MLGRNTLDQVVLTSYVVSKARTVRSVDEINHTVDVGQYRKGNAQNVWSGVYGTNSKDAAGFIVTNAARARGEETHFVDTVVEIPGLHSCNKMITPAMLAAQNWLHNGRLSSELRELIKELCVSSIASDFGSKTSRAAMQLDINTLFLAYPTVSARVLDATDLTLLVHPGFLKYEMPDGGPKKSLWVGSVRKDRASMFRSEWRFPMEALAA